MIRLWEKAFEASGLRRDKRFKSWVTFVDKVDRAQPGGYCFVGDFVRAGKTEVDLLHPRLLLVCSERGSRKAHYGSYRVVILRTDGTVEKTDIATKQTEENKTWALNIRQDVEKVLESLDGGPPPLTRPVATFLEGFPDEELASELRRRGYTITPPKTEE